MLQPPCGYVQRGPARHLVIMAYSVAGLAIGLAGVAALGVSLAACLVPAWRAVRVDPLDALRSE